MKEPLLQDEDPGLPPVVNVPRSPSRPLAAEPHMAHPDHLRSNLRSHFVFGPGFTQVLLLVCILMLGIVIGMKVSDYFHERQLEKSELALYRASQGNQPPDPAPASVPVQPQTAFPQVAAPSQPLPPPPVPSPTPAAAATLPAPPASTPSTPGAGRSSDFGNELALLQQERDLMRQRFDNLNSPPPQPGIQRTQDTANAPAPQPETGLPAARSPKSTSTSTEGAASPSKQEISAAEQRIRDAPALGKVLEYDVDWHFVVISCGTKHNLEAGRKLAIRRGGTILGLINVDEILPDQSVAELDGAWKTDAEAVKPQAGDDVLTFPPF